MGKRTRAEFREYTQSVPLLSIKTAIGFDQHSFLDISRFPDNALVSLVEIARRSLSKLATPMRTIAILHTTYRLTMRLISTHIRQWNVKFGGKWDSSLKGNSALRAHVPRAAGIDLAHREGQYVIQFLWGTRKFYDSIKAHLLIPQFVARGYPIELLAMGTLTLKSPRCLQVGSDFSDATTGCAPSILAGCLQSCSWARGLLLKLVKSLGYVLLDRSARSTLTICHNLRRARAAFNSCAMQPESARRETAQPC